MNKFISALLALSLFIPSACVGKPALRPYTHNPNAIVKVKCEDKDGRGAWFGTATRVAPDTYISVDHVTKENNCKVDGTAITVTYANADQDFSVFKGPVGKDIIPISCGGFKEGKAYIMRGYAGGGTDDFMQPVIFTMYDPSGHFALFVGDAFPGMSGGPVIDRKGRITGTVNISDPTGSVDLKDTIVCKRK